MYFYFILMFVNCSWSSKSLVFIFLRPGHISWPIVDCVCPMLGLKPWANADRTNRQTAITTNQYVIEVVAKYFYKKNSLGEWHDTEVLLHVKHILKSRQN